MHTPIIKLRTYVYIDSLQPQLAEYMATVSQGFLPIPGDACLWVEVSPGMAVHRLTDAALKATRVHLSQQVIEREFGSMVIHHRDQSDVREAGRVILSKLGTNIEERQNNIDLAIDFFTALESRALQRYNNAVNPSF